MCKFVVYPFCRPRMHFGRFTEEWFLANTQRAGRLYCYSYTIDHIVYKYSISLYPQFSSDEMKIISEFKSIANSSRSIKMLSGRTVSKQMRKRGELGSRRSILKLASIVTRSPGEGKNSPSFKRSIIHSDHLQKPTLRVLFRIIYLGFNQPETPLRKEKKTARMAVDITHEKPSHQSLFVSSTAENTSKYPELTRQSEGMSIILLNLLLSPTPITRACLLRTRNRKLR